MAHNIGRHKYRLTHHSEEFACPTCGAPVYVGDVAVGPEATTDGSGPFCSWYCAGADPAKCAREMAELSKAKLAEATGSDLFAGIPVNEP